MPGVGAVPLTWVWVMALVPVSAEVVATVGVTEAVLVVPEVVVEVEAGG